MDVFYGDYGGEFCFAEGDGVIVSLFINLFK